VKDDTDDLCTDSHNVMSRWKNYFCNLLNVHEVNCVRQIHAAAAPLVAQPSPLKLRLLLKS
jgi:hypothetical protein